MRRAIMLPIIAGLFVAGCSAMHHDSLAGSASPPLLTASEEGGIRRQIESNWNLGDLAGSPEVAGMVIELHLALLPDGTITDIKLLNDQPGNVTFRKLAESAMRAVKISSPLKLPPGETYTGLVLRFHPDQVIQ